MTPKESAPHVGLARKYRPQDFSEIIGQEAVSTTLRNAIADKKPAHAYLFFGPRGVGKTTAARILAKALNCKKGPTPDPCGQCDSCREIAQSSAIDVLELDAATHTQVDRIREMILETVALAPSRDRRKIFIIDEVHMLSTASFNALLKTLEEPPPHVVFILATTDPGKIPATIVSRCQRFRFRPLPMDVLVSHLQRLCKAEGIKADAKAVELLARSAGGSVRDSVSLLEQANAYAEGKLDAGNIRELLGSLPEDALAAVAGALLARNAGSLAKALESVLEEGADVVQFLRDLRERFHEAHLYRLGVGEMIDPAWRSLADPQSPETFSYLVQRLNKLLESLRFSDSPRLTLEMGLYGMLEAAYDAADWIRRLEALECRLASGETSDKLSREDSSPLAVRTGAQPPAQHLAQPSAPSVGERRMGEKASAEPPLTPSPSHKEGGNDNAWQEVLRQVQEEKPSLALGLQSGRLTSSDGSEWNLAFERAFDLERAKSNQELLESKLSSALGRTIHLHFEVNKAVEEKKFPAQATQDAAPEWRTPGEAAAAEDPAVKKVLEIFPGKVRHIKKK